MEFELLITELDQTTIQLDKINFLAETPRNVTGHGRERG